MSLIDDAVDDSRWHLDHIVVMLRLIYALVLNEMALAHYSVCIDIFDLIQLLVILSCLT